MDYEVETPTDLRLSNTKAAEDCSNRGSAVLNSELGWSISPGAARVHGALLTSFGFTPNSAIPAQNLVIRIILCLFLSPAHGNRQVLGMVLPWGAEATQRLEHWRTGDWDETGHFGSRNEQD